MVADRPTVLSVQKYESGPPFAAPSPSSPSPDGQQLVSIDGDTLAATKQEEFITKRKVELTTTKQIETRVKRQVVLEDGKIVDDSGPVITTSTTEDTDKKESEHTEHLTHGDDPELGEGWVAIEQLPEEAVVKETNERKVTTHDEVEDVLETEQVMSFGDLSNEGVVRAIREGADVRRALTQNNSSNGRQLVPLSPQAIDSAPKRVLNQSRRHDRTTDIEDTKEVSKVKENGNVVTEITRRHEHEEFHNEDIPDSDSDLDEFEHIENREGGHDYSHSKNEDLIEYIATPRGGTPAKGVKDLRNRHEDVIRSLNSQLGRASVTKSGSLWDEDHHTTNTTPTPPPRSRRRQNSPDIRSVHTPDHTSANNQAGMNHPRKYNTDNFPSALLNKDNDLGERKGYERREQSFGYAGPLAAGQRPLTRDSLESGNFGDSSYLTKHNNYYKTNETNNPAQTTVYENGDAEVTQRKTVERRQKNFSYEGPPQKQFHPKYIVGTPSTTMGRLKGIEHTGAIIEDVTDSPSNSRSQTLPRRRFYFGDDEGSLVNKSIEARSRTPEGGKRGKELRFGVDDINVSISNNYNNHNHHSTMNNHREHESRKSSTLNRSLSFTPRSLGGREKPSYNPINNPASSSPSYFTKENKFNQNYTSNPHLLGSPDLLSPKLITNMSRSVRDVHNMSYNHNTGHHYNNSDSFNFDSSTTNKQQHQSDLYTSNNISRSKRTFLDNVRKNSPDLYDPTVSRGSKGSSPARSMTPTNVYGGGGGGSPTRTFGNENRLSARPLNSPRALGGANSPLSDDYSETYRMSSSTPDNDYNKPRISTDTTSKFSRRTLRGEDGRAAGKVESSQTTTRTKSRYKESEIMYPNGRRVGSPAGFRTDFQPQLTSEGSVIIPVRDTHNNNKNSIYK